MPHEQAISRRSLLATGAGIVMSAPLPALAQGRGADRINPEQGVTAPEDLMKEHGVLNRCLLLYEEGIRRLDEGGEITPNVFHHTAQLIRHFVEEYHEKNEEKYIFPVFRAHGRLTDLVQTLLTQHRAGRTLTARILQLSTPDAFRAPNSREQIVVACRQFIRMYRPHEAREDTVLFPALRTLLTPRQVEALGDRMEEEEQAVLGKEGFERSVAQVESMEKALGIYDLKRFTPGV